MRLDDRVAFGVERHDAVGEQLRVLPDQRAGLHGYLGYFRNRARSVPKQTEKKSR